MRSIVAIITERRGTMWKSSLQQEKTSSGCLSLHRKIPRAQPVFLYSSSSPPPDTFSSPQSCRSPRPGEADGREYFFSTRETFEEKIAQNGLIEYAEYCGSLNRYKMDVTCYSPFDKAPISSLISLIKAVFLTVAEPVVSSRYSIVMATSKRARQIISGDTPMVDSRGKKPLSASQGNKNQFHIFSLLVQ